MPGGAAPCDRAPSAFELPTYEPGTLVEAVEVLGRRRLALAFQAAPLASAHALASTLGSWHGPLLLRERNTPAPPEAVSAVVRDVMEVARRGGPELLFRAGARLLGPALAALGGDLARQLAQRMPHPLGRLLLGELATATPRPAPAVPAVPDVHEVMDSLAEAVYEARVRSA
jgi:hypothetical protein